MVFGLFGAKPAVPAKGAAPAAAKEEPWPWQGAATEPSIRSTMQARIRYLTLNNYPVMAESPDFSQALVQLGATFNQRQKLRELWRDEVAKFNAANKKA